MINTKRKGASGSEDGLGVHGVRKAVPEEKEKKSEKERAKEETSAPAEQKPRKKKKKHGCRNCLLVFLIFNVILVGSIYFVGDYFTRKYVGMNLWNCFGVIYDITHANGKKIVTNKYGESDYTAFDLNLKQQLFLKSDVDLDIEKLVGALTEESKDEGEQTSGTVNTAFTRTVSALGASMNKDALMDEIAALYVRPNMDMARLDGYDESKHESEYIFRITDKQAAALLNKSIEIVDHLAPQIGEKLGEYGIDDIGSVLKVEQVIFGTRKGKAGETERDVTAATLTLSVDARKIADKALRKQVKQDLSLLVNIVLPKRMYVTVCVPLEVGASLDNYVYLNNMNDKKMDRAYTLISKILKLTGNETDIKQKLDDTVTDKVTGKLEKAEQYVSLASAKNGSLSIDVFETLINAFKLNKEEDGTDKPEEKQIHSKDVIRTLAGVVASDADKATVQEYDFMHQYRESATDKVVYLKTEPEDGAGFAKINYKQEFMDELARKYMLDLNGKDGVAGTEDDIDFDRLMRLFGLGEKKEGEEELELLDLFDASKLKQVPPGQSAKVQINTRMLGAILQSQIDTLIDGESSIGKYDPAIEYVVTYRTAAGQAQHTFLRAAISVGTDGLLPEGNAVGSILSGLIGDKLVITFDVDITPGLDTEHGESYQAGKVAYNDLTGERTQDILRVIGCFVDDFDKESLLEQIEQPIRDAIGRMDDVLKIEIGTSRIDIEQTAINLPVLPKDNASEIELPTVYGTIKQMMFADDDETNGELNKTITEAGIEDVLHAIDEAGTDKDGSAAAFEQAYVGDDKITTVIADGVEKTDYTESLQHVLQTYYVKNPTQYETFDELFGDGGIANASAFTADKFDFDKLFYDDTPTEELHPLFTDNDLGALIIEKMKGDSTDVYKNLTDVRGIRIYVEGGKHKMTLIVKLDANKLFEGKQSSTGTGGETSGESKYAKLLPADYVYLKATIRLDEYGYYNKTTGEAYANKDEADADTSPDKNVVSYYKTDLTINNMDDAKYTHHPYETMVAMVKSMGGADSVNFETTARDLGAAMRGRVEELEDSLGGSIEFVEGGIRLVSFYDFLKQSLLPNDAQATAETVRAALQGLQAKKTEDGATVSEYNYDAGLFGVNPISLAGGKVGFGDIDMGGGKIVATDTVFGRGLQNGFLIENGGYTVYEQNGLLTSGGTTFALAQLNILHHGLTSGERDRGPFLRGYYADANGLTDAGDVTYLEMNFSMKLSDVTGDNKLGSALPETVYITVLFEQLTDGTYSRVYFRINEMTEAAQHTLFAIAGIETGPESEIGKKLTECESALNTNYNGATFAAATSTQAPSFGTIAFTIV